MGFLDTLGVGNFFGDFSFKSVLAWGAIFFICAIILILVAVIFFAFYYKKLKKVSYKFQVPIFIDLNGKPKRTAIDQAREIFVPDTNISLFYLKNKKIYIARPTRWMQENECWYKILPNGEWVNFELSDDPEKSTMATADYDHRDTRYAYVNLKEIIKRNYRDKSVKWWKEYSHVISFIIIAFVFVGAMVILLWRVGDMFEQLGPIAKDMLAASESMAKAVEISQNLNSGVVGA